MKYESHPTIEEIQETRRRILARFENDPHKLGQYLQAQAGKRKGHVPAKERARAHG